MDVLGYSMDLYGSVEDVLGYLLAFSFIVALGYSMVFEWLFGLLWEEPVLSPYILILLLALDSVCIST